MSWVQCSECGKNNPREEMQEIAVDDDGCGGVEGVYMCDECAQVAQIDDYWMDQIDSPTNRPPTHGDEE